VGSDSAMIEIGFHEFGTEPYFTEKLIIKNTVDTWTHFRINIPEKYWKKDFYAIRTLFVASAGVNFAALQECKGNIGSTLWIDNINLIYIKENGIKQNLLSTLKANIFPNPATEVLNIELNEFFAGNIVVYDLSGRMIMEEMISGTQSQINISTLSTGNYIYKLMSENSIFAQGKFIVTK
jgi:hypothetical protein